MGEIFRNESVTAYLESLIADGIDGLDPTDYNVSADADGGFMRGIDLLHPYLRDGAFDEVMQVCGVITVRRQVFFTTLIVLGAREVIRSIDGTVPQKLFVDEITAIFEKHGIPLAKLVQV